RRDRASRGLLITSNGLQSAGERLPAVKHLSQDGGIDIAVSSIERRLHVMVLGEILASLFKLGDQIGSASLQRFMLHHGLPEIDVALESDGLLFGRRIAALVEIGPMIGHVIVGLLKLCHSGFRRRRYRRNLSIWLLDGIFGFGQCIGSNRRIRRKVCLSA